MGNNTGLRQQQHSGLQSGEPGVSSALGLMSLDDPNLLVGLTDDGASSFFPEMNLNMNLGGMPSLSGIPADDPDATPMPLKENPPPPSSAPPVSLTIPLRSSSASGSAPGNNNGSALRDGDMKELRDFWKQYMRTPFSGPEGPNSSLSQPPSVMSPPGYRRPRVASMPSSKTPTIAVSLQQQSQQQSQQQQNDPNRGESGVRTTLQEDLKSYEAAVMARKAPTNLNLVPKMRRGTVPGLPPPHHSSSTVDGGHDGSPVVSGKGVGVVPLVKFDILQHHQHRPDTRPSSSSTNKSGSSGDGSVSSSLAGAFGGLHQQQHLHHQQHSPHLVSQFALRRGSPASSTTGGSSSRASSVSVDHDDRDDTSDDGGSGDSGRVGRLRPAFKRLASTTLGPPNAKRTAFLVSGNGSPTMMSSGGGSTGGDGSSGQMDSQSHLSGGGSMDVAQGYAPGALGMH